MSTSRTVSAIPITSTSLCPAPTVSRKTTSLPAASSTSSACSAASARPPRWPRVPIERMKTSGSRKWSLSRIRSPSSAPCENGLERIDRDDADGHLPLADVPDQRRDEARLPDPGRAGDADRVRGAGLRVEVGDDAVREWVAVLDERDRARERTPVALPDAGGKVLTRPVAAAGHREDSSGRLPRVWPCAEPRPRRAPRPRACGRAACRRARRRGAARRRLPRSSAGSSG